MFPLELRICRRTTKLSSRGRSGTYELQEADVRPRSAAAPGSACLAPLTAPHSPAAADRTTAVHSLPGGVGCSASPIATDHATDDPPPPNDQAQQRRPRREPLNSEKPGSRPPSAAAPCSTCL